MGRPRTGARLLRGVAAFALALLAGGAAAYGATGEVHVVSALAYYDPATQQVVQPDTGWALAAIGTGRVEIGSAFGAPAGLGHDALMLDTPAAGDSVAVSAVPGTTAGAFPDVLMASPDQRLGFWLYRSSASTSSAGPVVEGLLVRRPAGLYTWVTFDPVANGYTTRDRWTWVDATAAGATWTVRTDGSQVGVPMTWPQLVDLTTTTLDGTAYRAAFEYGLTLSQAVAGTSSAVDGVSAGTTAWSSVTNFELQPTSAHPVLDTCKNGGWLANHPLGTYRNQGECVAAVVAAR